MVTIKEVKLTLSYIGGRIRELRIERGESQTVFGSRIGVSRPTVKAIERGEPTVQVGHWMAACGALGYLAGMRQPFRPAIPRLYLPDLDEKPRRRAPRRRVR